jgi:hypothetical protein
MKHHFIKLKIPLKNENVLLVIQFNKFYDIEKNLCIN